MARKRSRTRTEASAGIPEWVVTFGDMMSLLLCFFILLQMFSELKKDQEYQRVVTAIKEAFGYSGAVGVLPVNDPPLRSLIEQLEHMALKHYDEKEVSQSSDLGIDGPRTRVTTVRDGIVFTLGGPSTFDEMSAEIKPEVREELAKLAVMLAGRTNKIEIVGHASPKYFAEGQRWSGPDELSFQRALNVKDVLVELGLDDRVFRIQAAGIREPVRPRAVDPAEAAVNRRVDIILTEQLVEELNTDAWGTDEDLARGG